MECGPYLTKGVNAYVTERSGKELLQEVETHKEQLTGLVIPLCRARPWQAHPVFNPVGQRNTQRVL
jgi:hypothetical protein